MKLFRNYLWYIFCLYVVEMKLYVKNYRCLYKIFLCDIIYLYI